ncbi:MAG: hypothetical protein EA373_03330 [Oceanospirillales bacterium]|nr:MAG: hypothetical protein EA373_03330 [Oceanospirillales bacterium]
MEQIVTDNLQATIRRWLTQFSDHSPITELPDWSELMQSLQQQGWQELPDQHAELLAVMTQESIEFTRFAGQLLQQHDQIETASFFKDFHQHINRLSDDLIFKRWLLPEQLGSMIKTRFWDSSTGIEMPWLKMLNGLTNLPELDLPFAQQSAYREFTRLINEHQQAFQDYTNHYSRINSKAINQLSEAIEQSEQQISSLKELHRLWVDAYEISYAERIATQEYQLAHGRISNTLMQLKLWFQGQRNRYLTQLGIASEASLNLAFEKIHALTKQVRQLESLQQQTLSLTRELEAIKQQINPSRDRQS